MNLWLFVIDQGTGISLPTGTSLDGVPICELVPYGAISDLPHKSLPHYFIEKVNLFMSQHIF